MALSSISKDSQGCDVCNCKCKTQAEVCPSALTCDSGKLDITYGTVGTIEGCITNCTCQPVVKPTPICVNVTSCDMCNSVLGYTTVLNQTTGCTECSCNQCPELSCSTTCSYGFTLKDSGRGDGCQACNCSCAPLADCNAQCPYGYTIKNNEIGCPSCGCNPAPECKPDDASTCDQVTCPYGGVLKGDQYGCQKCVCLSCEQPPIAACQANCPYGYTNYTVNGSDGSRCPNCQCLKCPVVNVTKCNEDCVYGGSAVYDSNTDCDVCKCNPCPANPPNCQSVCGNKLNHTYGTDDKGCATCNCVSCPAVECDSIQCPYGYQYRYINETGCRACLCNPAPVCSTTPPDCSTLNCPNGYTITKDTKGCDQCKCNDTICPQPEPDCIAQCKYGVAEVSYDSNKCKQCKCLDLKCPPTNCLETCGTSGVKEQYADENGCIHCTCNQPPSCSVDTDCKTTCGDMKYLTYYDDYNCTRCKCLKPTCPETQVNCTATCGNTNYDIIKDANGCDTCKCSGTPVVVCPPVPDCNERCGGAQFFDKVQVDSSGCSYCQCKSCVLCKCCKSKKITVPIVKHVPERIYTPYIVWYDPAFFDKVKNNFQTQEEIRAAIEKRYNYILVLRKKTTIYRRALIHLRVVLKQLVLKKKISLEMYKKADEMARKRKKILEEEIKDQVVSFCSIDNHIKAVIKLIKELGFDSHAPATCIYIAGHKRCGLRPSFVNELASSYLKDGIFTKVIYTKIPTTVTNLKKNLATQTVTYQRTSATWKVQVIKLHKRVRSAVWKLVIKDLVRGSKKINRVVRRVLKLIKKDKNNYEKIEKLVSKKNKNAVVKKILLRKFKAEVVDSARDAINSASIKELNEQFKPTSTETVLPSKVTDEIMFLPKDILAQSEDILSTLLSQRYAYNPDEDKRQYE